MDLHKLTRLLEALSDSARLRLLALCQHGELTVKVLTEATGMSQPRVSRHLRILVEADVLQRFRETHWVYYRMRFDGDAVSLARTILASAASGDRNLQTDASRLDAALANRARALRAISEADVSGKPVLSAILWSRLEQVIQQFAAKALGSSSLGNLLDVGTGSGRMLRIFAADAHRAEGVDTSDAMRQAARTMLREAGLANCSVRDGDMYNLPCDDGEFDTVVFGHVLTASAEPWRAIREAARALKTGGHLLVMELLPDEMPVEAWCQSLAGWFAKAGIDIIAEDTLDLPDVRAVLYLGRREPRVAGKFAAVNLYSTSSDRAAAR